MKKNVVSLIVIDCQYNSNQYMIDSLIGIDFYRLLSEIIFVLLQVQRIKFLTKAV